MPKCNNDDGDSKTGDNNSWHAIFVNLVVGICVWHNVQKAKGKQKTRNIKENERI